jgi:elongation factor 1 alpha-like protein
MYSDNAILFTATPDFRIAIFTDGDSLPWAAAGQNITLYLTAVDPIHLNVGSVLCPVHDVIPLATVFTARVIVFDIAVPITAGTSVSLQRCVGRSH